MMAAQAEEFARRGVKLIGLSCDDVQSHTDWIKDIEAYNVSSSSLFLSEHCMILFTYLVSLGRGVLGELLKWILLRIV